MTDRAIELHQAADRLRERLKTAAEDAYLRYINHCRRDECCGQAFKLEHGQFGQKELSAHIEAQGEFGRHRGLYEAIAMLDAELTTPAASGEGTDRPRKPRLLDLVWDKAQVIGRGHWYSSDGASSSLMHETRVFTVTRHWDRDGKLVDETAERAVEGEWREWTIEDSARLAAVEPPQPAASGDGDDEYPTEDVLRELRQPRPDWEVKIARLTTALRESEQRLAEATKIREEWSMDFIAWRNTSEGRHASKATQIMIEADNRRIDAEQRAERLERVLKSHAPDGHNVTNRQYAELHQKFIAAVEFFTDPTNIDSVRVIDEWWTNRPPGTIPSNEVISAVALARDFKRTSTALQPTAAAAAEGASEPIVVDGRECAFLQRDDGWLIVPKQQTFHMLHLNSNGLWDRTRVGSDDLYATESAARAAATAFAAGQTVTPATEK